MPSTKNIDAINNYKVPETRQELRRFNGLCNFVQKFVEGASIIMKPLHKLGSPKTEFIWSDECNSAFEKFKTELAKSTGLRHKNNDYPLVVTTDASGDSGSGILYQINPEGDYEPLAFFSRPFTESEKRAGSRHREAYAIHDSVKHFEYFLLGN